MANPETLDNSNEDLIQENLMELKDQIKPKKQETVNENAPEMTMDEIMKMSDNDIKQLFSYFESSNPRSLPYQYIQNKDKKGEYIIVNNKKIYWQSNNPKEGTPYFYFDAPESWSNLSYVAIAIKKGNKLRGIYCNGDKTYRGELEGDGYIEPKGGYEKRIKQVYNN